MLRPFILLLVLLASVTAVAKDWALQRFAFTEVNGTTSSEITVTGLRVDQLYYVYGVDFTRTDGDASDYELKCGNVTAFGNTANDGLAFSLDVQTVATPTIHLFDPPAIIQADSSGEVFCDANWESGTNNDATGALNLKKAVP